MTDKIICEHCCDGVGGKPKRTFLGFQNYTCSVCHKNTLYPLTGGYRLIYWLVIGASFFGFLVALQAGNIIIPGLLFVAAVVGLVKDYGLRKKIHTKNNTEKKSKSFRLTSFHSTDGTKKWYQLRKMDRREYGYIAIVGLLVGAIVHGVIGDVLALVGLICGIVWIYQTIRQRRLRQSSIASSISTEK